MPNPTPARLVRDYFEVMFEREDLWEGATRGIYKDILDGYIEVEILTLSKVYSSPVVVMVGKYPGEEPRPIVTADWVLLKPVGPKGHLLAVTLTLKTDVVERHA